MEPHVGRVFAARSIALCVESCFEAASTNMGDGLSGIFPKFISRMDLQGWAMGSSQPSGLVILFLRVCQWVVLKEANVALRYVRARVAACGREKLIGGLAQMSSLASRK